MGKIIILDENTSNKIAAGEVVEKPASVIKELVENSIDAGASSITVEIRNGGISYIKVIDNGSGIDEDDAEIAFERHATSKIRNSNDLESISTMGFRGEALASIAAVSSVELITRVKDKPHGMHIKIQGGMVKEVKQTGCPVGTTFIVRDLFYNTPARFKFLKKDSTEASYISDIINRIALSKPQISFRLISNNSTVVHTPGNNDLLSVIYSVYGKDTAKDVLPIEYSDNKIKITGYAGKPEIARANRNYQSVFVNGRYIKSRLIMSAVDEAYKTFLMKSKFPFIVMNLELNPIVMDINVHPTKMEVRFSEEQEIFRSVYHAVSSALLGKSEIRPVHLDFKEKNIFNFNENKPAKVNYTQQNLSFEKNSIREETKGTRGFVENNAASFKTDTASFKVEAPSMKFSQKSNNSEPIIKNSFENEASKNISLKIEEASIPQIYIDTKKEHQTASAEQISADEVKLQDEKALETEKDECNLNEGHRTDILNDAQIIGQAFSTYVILQLSNELVLIDQHAAHERIMYENIKKKYQNDEFLSQNLITPIVIELTNHEIKIIEEEKEFFNKIGFIYENFGNNSIIIRAVPYMDNNDTVKELFLDVLDKVMSGKYDYSKLTDDALYTIACKAAVKANKKLDNMEIRGIIDHLTKLENPFTCPHGRPTAIKLTKYELEKLFKRIV